MGTLSQIPSARNNQARFRAASEILTSASIVGMIEDGDQRVSVFRDFYFNARLILGQVPPALETELEDAISATLRAAYDCSHDAYTKKNLDHETIQTHWKEAVEAMATVVAMRLPAKEKIGGHVSGVAQILPFGPRR